jgi:hypothetical protein
MVDTISAILKDYDAYRRSGRRDEDIEDRLLFRLLTLRRKQVQPRVRLVPTPKPKIARVRLVHRID